MNNGKIIAENGGLDFFGEGIDMSFDLDGDQVWENGYVGATGGAISWWPNGVAMVSYGNPLHLEGESDYFGGTSSSGSGTVIQVGDAHVYRYPGASETILGVASYIWDGERVGAPGVYFDSYVEPNAHLVIEGDIGSSALDGFDGTVHVREGAVLEVQKDWIVEGTLVLHGGTVRGGEIHNMGSVIGYGTVESDFINEGSVIASSAELEGGIDFTGTFTCAGGTCTPDPCPCEP
ncbi:MAG: DUF342 domain-containing protein [bacterium]|nr:DUF342 domain-containing protein [bacterium]